MLRFVCMPFGLLLAEVQCPSSHEGPKKWTALAVVALGRVQAHVPFPSFVSVVSCLDATTFVLTETMTEQSSIITVTTNNS
jgi:hypothetical protein